MLSYRPCNAVEDVFLSANTHNMCKQHNLGYGGSWHFKHEISKSFVMCSFSCSLVPLGKISRWQVKALEISEISKDFQHMSVTWHAVI